MDASRLSTYQLVQLAENTKLDQEICKAAKTELERRNLSNQDLQQVQKEHELKFLPDDDSSLSSSIKWIFVFCPFFLEIHGLVAGRMLATNQKRKWKQYWKYILLGYILWTVAIIVFASFSRHK